MHLHFAADVPLDTCSAVSKHPWGGDLHVTHLIAIEISIRRELAVAEQHIVNADPLSPSVLIW